MYSDITGYIPLFIITAGVGAIIGAATGAYRAYKNGDSLIGGALNGALVGGAVGLALGLGIVNLGPVIAGAATASTSAATTSFAISTAISFAAGATGYTVEEIMNDRSPSFLSALGHGTIVAFESMISFGFGGIIGSVGTVGKLNNFISKEWVAKQFFIQEFTLPSKYGLDTLRYLVFDWGEYGKRN